MAERRMFAKTIIDSDAFLDMPMSAQALYFHLAMRADDEGFINNPRKIMRMVGAGDDDAKILLAKRFLIQFETGVVVIKHWRIHNYIRNDRFKPTVYKEERGQLAVKDNGAYTMDTTGIPSDRQLVYQMDTQDRLELGKVSIGKDRLDKDREDNNSFFLSADDDELYQTTKAKLEEVRKQYEANHKRPTAESE